MYGIVMYAKIVKQLHIWSMYIPQFWWDRVSKLNSKIENFVLYNRHPNCWHKSLLTSSGRANRPGELCWNFPFSNNLTQKVNFPTRIPDCDSHSSAFLDLFLSSNASICSTMAFPPLVNSDVVVSIFINFPTNSQ